MKRKWRIVGPPLVWGGRPDIEFREDGDFRKRCHRCHCRIYVSARQGRCAEDLARQGCEVQHECLPCNSAHNRALILSGKGPNDYVDLDNPREGQ